MLLLFCCCWVLLLLLLLFLLLLLLQILCKKCRKSEEGAESQASAATAAAAAAAAVVAAAADEKLPYGHKTRVTRFSNHTRYNKFTSNLWSTCPRTRDRLLYNAHEAHGIPRYSEAQTILYSES